MRIQLVILSALLSVSTFASDESEMKSLFAKYDQVMSSKTDQVEDVFTKKFLEENEGKEGFIKKVKSLAKPKLKSVTPPGDVSFKKGLKNDLYFAKYTEKSNIKSQETHGGSQFIVIREEGKLKIDGTISDGE
jgi:hypothetical protein